MEMRGSLLKRNRLLILPCTEYPVAFTWQTSWSLCALFIVGRCPFPIRVQIMVGYSCQAFRKQAELPKILKTFLVVVVVVVVGGRYFRTPESLSF